MIFLSAQTISLPRKLFPIKPVLALVVGLFLVFSASRVFAQQEIPLWENGAPGFKHEHAEFAEDKHETGRLDRYISFVSKPTLTFYPVAGTDAARAAPVVLIVPGGGYRYVCIDKEGHEAARWLNSAGIAAAVLKYRVLDPAEERSANTVSPLLDLGDANRAMRLIRLHAQDWHIDPERIGVMGFSAGGVMAIRNVTDADDGNPGATDPVEKMSSRPDFVALIYSGLPDKKMPKTDKKMPPFFIAHAADDTKAKASVSADIFKRIADAGGSAELHIFHRGEHGFGVMPPAGTVRSWTTLYIDWMRDLGLL